MNEFLTFVQQLVLHYPPEYVVAYILAGFGVALVQVTSTKVVLSESFPVALAQVVLGTFFGTVTCLFILAVWPAYFVGGIYRKICRE